MPVNIREVVQVQDNWGGLFLRKCDSCARYDREGQDGDWQRPLEDIASNGCPGSYYRSAFVRSLWPFRRKASDGNRIANPLLDRCDDRLVLEWIHVLEDFEDAEHADFLAKVSGGH